MPLRHSLRKACSAVAIFAGAFLGRHLGFLVLGAHSLRFFQTFSLVGSSWTPHGECMRKGLVGYLGGLLATTSTCPASSNTPRVQQGSNPTTSTFLAFDLGIYIGPGCFGLVIDFACFVIVCTSLNAWIPLFYCISILGVNCLAVVTHFLEIFIAGFRGKHPLAESSQNTISLVERLLDKPSFFPI